MSVLAPDHDARVVGDIIQISRDRNGRLGICGALVFDGAHFAQMLRGGRAEVESLMQSIASDGRHTVLAVLLQQDGAPQPDADRWLAGYCEPDTVISLVDMAGMPPEHIRAAFHALLASADMA